MRKVLLRPCVLIVLTGLMSACASSPPQPAVPEVSASWLESDLFGDRPDIVTPDELFGLRAEQQRPFLDYFSSPVNEATPPHERIYNYLLTATADFDFHSDTRTATQALDQASGNCLSLAILTTALARLVDVDTGYQLVDSTPVFERRGGVVSKGIHVRSILYDPSYVPARNEAVAFQRPGIQFDYFPDDTQRTRLLGNLSADAYVAMYYSNVAGEAIAAGDIHTAYWHLLESLEHESDNPIALNMLAIVYRRAGDEVTAEQIYLHGIETLPDHVSYYRNYRYLLIQQGRMAEADRIGKTLLRLDDANPFNWVNAGRQALEDEQFREAIAYFDKALDIAPYLHEAHALMAIAYLKLGNTARGERQLEYALENAQRKSARSLYQAKLTLMRQ